LKQLPKLKYLVILGIIIQLLFLYCAAPVTLQEAIDSNNSARGIAQHDLVIWLTKHPTLLTLMSSYSNDTVSFDAHLELKNVIYEGNGKYWNQAIENPVSIVQRIILSPETSDSIWKSNQNNHNLFDGYTLVYPGKYFRVYDQTENISNRLTSNHEHL
jgi:hypothetical protein